MTVITTKAISSSVVAMTSLRAKKGTVTQYFGDP
jgi:hypothetical protein